MLRNLGTAVQALADRHGAAARRAAQQADEQVPTRADCGRAGQPGLVRA